MKIRNKGKKFYKNGLISATESKWTGEEPTWENADKWDEEKLKKNFSRGLQFYNYYLDMDDYYPFIEEFLKKEKPKNKKILKDLKKVPRCGELVMCGKMCRMINLGMPREFDKKNYTEEIESYLKRMFLKNPIVAKVKKESDPNKPSVFEYAQEKVRKGVLIYLEEMLDKWITTPTVKVNKVNVFSLLQGVNPAIGSVKVVEEWLVKQKNELVEAIDKTCPQMVEGYSYLSKPAIRKRITLLEEMVNEVELYRASKRANKKPRKKKEISADKLVSKIKCLNSSKDHNVVSIDPVKIVGAKKVFLFNVKYRKMILLEGDELTVKGTTVKNWDPKKSFTTTLRKPQETISILISKTEKQIANHLNKLTTKKTEANGRINGNTLILKAI